MYTSKTEQQLNVKTEGKLNEKNLNKLVSI